MKPVEMVSESYVEDLLLALAAKNASLCKHSVHVGIAATNIAALMRGNGFGSMLLSEHETFIAGLMHDMGKLTVDDDILTKKGSLNSHECEIMRQHTQWGYGLASRIEELQHLAPYVLQHHERPGRKGYPKGLDTDDIMLMSRILNIADRFTGMLVDRPYRKAIPSKQIIPSLEEDITIFFGVHAADIIDTLLSTDKYELESATENYLMDTGIPH